MVVLLLAGGATLTWYAGTHLTYATGLAGTAGHFQVDECVLERVGSNKPQTRCNGVFRSSDGRIVDLHATFRGNLPTGDTVTMRQTAPGAYERSGFTATSGWLAMSLFGLLVLLLGCLTAWSGFRRSPVPRAVLVPLGWLGAAALLSALIGGVAGLAGAL
jgi:hypothetical protein